MNPLLQFVAVGAIAAVAPRWTAPETGAHILTFFGLDAFSVVLW